MSCVSQKYPLAYVTGFNLHLIAFNGITGGQVHFLYLDSDGRQVLKRVRDRYVIGLPSPTTVPTQMVERRRRTRSGTESIPTSLDTLVTLLLLKHVTAI